MSHADPINSPASQKSLRELSSMQEATKHLFEANIWRLVAHRDCIRVMSVDSNDPDFDLFAMKYLKGSLNRLRYVIMAPSDHELCLKTMSHIKTSRRLNIEVRRDDSYDVAVPDEVFDLIIFNNNSHTYPEWKKTLKKARSQLRAGGQILVISHSDGVIQRVHDEVLVEKYGMKPSPFYSGGKLMEYLESSKSWLVEHNEVVESAQLSISEIASKSEKGNSVLSLLMQCDASALPSDVLDTLVEGLISGTSSEYVNLSMSYTLFCKAFKEPVPDAERNEAWWPENGFHNNGKEMWQKSRDQWLVRLQPRPPLPPEVDHDVVLDGLSKVQRQFELPGPMRLPEILELFLDLWEADSDY